MDQVLEFCKNNGYKFATFVNFGPKYDWNIKKMAAKNGIQVRFINELTEVQQNLIALDFLIVNFTKFISDGSFIEILELIHKHEVQRSLVVVESIETFKTVASQHQKNALFYLYDVANVNWKKVLTINNNSKGKWLKTIHQ